MSAKTRRMAGLLAGAFLLAGSAVAQDPTPPAFRLPKTAEPVSYTLDLTIDPGETRFQGTVQLVVRLKEATRVLWLNARDIEMREAVARVRGARVGVRTVPGGPEFVGFAFDREIGPGSLELRLEYRGAIREHTSQGVFRQKDGNDWYVYTQLESVDARRAVPCFDEPSYKVPWQLTLRVPAGTTAVSNTPVLAQAAGADGFRVYRFAQTTPLPSYLLAFAVGPFEYVDAGRAGEKKVPVRIVVPRGKAGRTRLAVESTAPLLGILEKYFGTPYPYAKLDQLVIPQTVTFGAMENAGLITWGERYLLEEPGRESITLRRLGVFVNAHEIAHQWFGDLVTPAWWDDIWLNESFADWAAHKALLVYKPEWDSATAQLDDLFRALDADSLLAARQIHQPVRSNDDIDNAFDPISYEKGAAVLAMFESWIGEAKFRVGVRRYLRAHAHGVATSQDFLTAVESAGAPGAASAFATFLDQPGVPLVDAAISCAVPQRPTLELSQTRYLPVGSEAPAPQLWHIPICARDSRKPSRRSCTLLQDARGTLALPPGPCPAWALLRSGGSGYYRVRYEKDLASRLASVASSLPVEERGFLLRDTAGLAAGGAVSVAWGLALSEREADDPNWFLADASTRLPSDVSQDAVAPDARESFARWVRQRWGHRAGAMGFAGPPGEGDDARRLRKGLVPFVANAGEDAGLRAQARDLALRWLEDRRVVDTDIVPALLEVAAIPGDRALFDRFLAEAKRAPERSDRERLLSAMGSFRDPALRGEALGIILTDAFDPLEAVRILRGAAFSVSPEARAGAWEFLKARYDAVLEKLPLEARGSLPLYAAGSCDEAHRRDVEAFFKERVAKLSGGPRNLAKTLESIAQCDAFRRTAEAEVRQFLEASSGDAMALP